MYKKLSFLSILVYILILFPADFLSAADELGYRNWQTVLAGEVIAPLTPASFGFTAITDGGLLTAFSESGTVLWQKPMNTREKGLSSSFTGDFIFTAGGTTLSLYNPSGNLLWSEETPSPIIEKPFPGFDGRVFVKEKFFLSSYTLTGLRRFRIGITEGRMELMTLNDGSLLHIQKKEISGKSTALRISPFGKILEEIVFTGIISCAAESSEGIILGFTTGTIAMCSVIDGSAETKWSIGLEDDSPLSLYDWDGTMLVFLQNGRAARFLYGEQRALWVSTSVFENPVLACEASNEYAIVKTSASLVCITKDGVVEKNIDISSYKNLFTTITKGGLFVVCHNDWTIRAYRVQTLEPRYAAKRNYPYEPLEKTGIELYRQAQILLTQEDAGTSEGPLMSRTSYYLENLQNYYMLSEQERRKLSSEVNAVTITSDITTASLFGTAQFSSFWPFILEREKDPSIIRSVLQAVHRCAYDEDGEILDAVAKKLIQERSGSDQMLASYCDTVVELCRFMGRPALMRRGKDILVSLLSSKYSTSVQNYARKSLEKIIELEI
ncbi:MAG TPA: hypothetical protein PLR39_05235 [Treponemataceae bacterium]|nr:hypothetical protein [Treponemataceae bacterium]